MAVPWAFMAVPWHRYGTAVNVHVSVMAKLWQLQLPWSLHGSAMGLQGTNMALPSAMAMPMALP